MGFYLNPPERTQRIGRQLFGNSFTDFTVQLESNECLVALGDRIMFQFAGLCFNEREFANFYSQNNSMASLGFYAVPKTEFPDYFVEETKAAEVVPVQQKKTKVRKVPVVENFRDQKHFTLAQVLSVTTGVLCDPCNITCVYEILDFMTGDSLMTHQLGRAGEQVKPYIFNRHPQLRNITEAMVSGRANHKERVDALREIYGDDFGLYPIADGEYAPQEPIQELVNMLESKGRSVEVFNPDSLIG